jgi:pimeloyl-ACP methyl ester carboxylesterase
MRLFAESASESRSVSFLSTDNFRLRGQYWEPRDENAISLLLIHDLGSDRSVWEPFVPLFRTRRWGVLTFDLRGHGESVRQDVRFDLPVPPANEPEGSPQYQQDVKAALGFLARQPKAHPAKIATIGVGLGGDLAYAASGCGWGNASTVCIGLDEARARTFTGMARFAPSSIYLLYGAGDPVSAASVHAFSQAAAYPAEAKPYECSAGGIELFTQQQPEILARSIAWIERTI